MRSIFFVVLVSVCFAAMAQYDDMPDYRSKRDMLSKIPEKEVQADVSTFTMAGIDLGISRLPLRTLSISDFGENFLKFDSGNIKIAITSAPFEPAKHKLQYVDKYLARIDSKGYFGSYSKVPKKVLKSLVVVIDHDTVAIPAIAYTDLYEPKFTYNEGGTAKTYNAVYYSANNHDIYIYLLCNDGMGGYEVTWVIQDKKYLRRILDFNILKN